MLRQVVHRTGSRENWFAYPYTVYASLIGRQGVGMLHGFPTNMTTNAQLLGYDVNGSKDFNTSFVRCGTDLGCAHRLDLAGSSSGLSHTLATMCV